MIKQIKYLVEDYFSSTEQMNTVMKNQQKQQKKFDKNNEARQQFIKNILGKITYNKYVNKGVLAPVPLSALHLTYDDFMSLYSVKNNDEVLMDKLITEIKKSYNRNDFKFVSNGVNEILQTNIVFKTFDDIIDFLFILEKSFKKIYKTDTVNWNNIAKKFRNYLK